MRLNSTTPWRRLLRYDAHLDHLVLFLLGFIPILVSYATGTADDLVCRLDDDSRRAFSGFMSKPNWYLYPLFLPAGLYFFRHVVDRLFGLRYAYRPDTQPTLLNVIDEHGRANTCRDLQRTALHPANFFIILLADIAFHLFDLRDPLTTYLPSNIGTTQLERFEWSQFSYLTSTYACEHAHRGGVAEPIAETHQFLLIGTAYFNQFILLFLAFGIFLLLLRHNLFYLSLVYLRVGRREPREAVVLDFDDQVERRFGLGRLHHIFNLQVLVAAVAGAILLFSRYANVSKEYTEKLYQSLSMVSLERLFEEHIGVLLEFASSLEVTFRDVFSDFGQIAGVLIWLAFILVISLPSLVKFLPLKSSYVRQRWEPRRYLQQFVPPGTKAFVDHLETDSGGSNEEWMELINRFACSAFWPAGDFLAKVFWTVAFIVMFNLLLPLPPQVDQWANVVKYAAAVLILSVGCTGVVLTMFRFVLKLVSTDLTRCRQD